MPELPGDVSHRRDVVREDIVGRYDDMSLVAALVRSSEVNGDPHPRERIDLEPRIDAVDEVKSAVECGEKSHRARRDSQVAGDQIAETSSAFMEDITGLDLAGHPHRNDVFDIRRIDGGDPTTAEE